MAEGRVYFTLVHEKGFFMDIIDVISKELDIERSRTTAAVELLDEGNTVPFIARYRKEATKELNDEQLRTLSARLDYLRGLEERKAQVIASIEEQGKMTPDLRAKIENALQLVEVEDLYLPFRPKRRTRASIARERGLESLAGTILEGRFSETLEELAMPYVDPEKEVADTSAALAGASDILAEQTAETASFRERIRKLTADRGMIVCTAKDETASSVYENYYDYQESIRKAAGHRILAINRGEKEKYLTVKIEAPDDEILAYLQKQVIRPSHPATDFLKTMLEDSYERLIAPAIERDIRADLTAKAHEGAISVFGKNVRQLLMQPPVKGRTVLGWDPAFRTGCKLAVTDPSGKVLDTAVIFPTAPTNEMKKAQAARTLDRLIDTYHVSVISVGNGTASRESEQFIADYLHKKKRSDVQYVIVSEAGASVYSASELATKEFPAFDVGQRSAASIARRLQDPLSELVKIDPKAIGVGQYQHDVNQKKLSETLDGVVEDCVNAVGVDLNTASAPLLGYVAGISSAVASNIVGYRESSGPFKNRKELLKVPKLGPKAFEQCAGFLRISGGSEPFDSTAVHPESYSAARQLLEEWGLDASCIQSGGIKIPGGKKNASAVKETAKALGIGEPTLRDIIAELEKPGRDPREDMPKPILRSDVLEMKDLKSGMILKGTVRNVIDFGVFVDIGVHQDGLVHISQICDRYIKHPLEAVSVGDVVEVKVLSVDPERKRISLTMKI